MSYITGTIRFDDRDQRRRFKSAAKKLGLPLNRFMLLACQRLESEVLKGKWVGSQIDHRLVAPVAPEGGNESIVAGGMEPVEAGV